MKGAREVRPCAAVKEGEAEMSIMQIGAIGVLGALMAVQFKASRAEYAVYVSVAVGIFLFFCITRRLGLFVDVIARLKSYINVDVAYIQTMLKMVGLTYIAEFASGICKDAGHQAIAVQIETFCKLTILALGMPVLLALFEAIREFMA